MVNKKQQTTKQKEATLYKPENKKTVDKVTVIMITLQSLTFAALLTIIGLLTGIQVNTNQLDSMQNAITKIEERTNNIEDMKSGIDKLLGKNGIAEITPTDGGFLSTDNVKIIISPNSVTQKTWFSIDKISASNLPANLPDNLYIYDDGIEWSSQGIKLHNSAYVQWGISADTDCDEIKILYWNNSSKSWQDVIPDICSTASASNYDVEFSVNEEGYYVLTRLVN